MNHGAHILMGRADGMGRVGINSMSDIKYQLWGGTWVAQSVKRPTSAQVMILRSVSSSPASGSGLADGVEPAWVSLSLSLSLSLLALSLSLPLSLKINKLNKNFKVK